MAISCIRGQIVNLCTNRSINRTRGGGYYRTLQQQQDTVAFQVRLTEYNGDNLVSDGDFATGGPWSFGTGWSYDAVNNEADASAATGTLGGLATITGTYYYRLKWTIKNYVTGQLSVEAPIGTVRLGAAFPSTGNSFDFTYHWEQATNSSGVEFNASTFTGSVDDVSIVAMSTIGIRVVDEAGTIVFSDYTNSNGYVTYLQEGNTSPDLISPYPAIARANVEFVWDDLGLSDGCYRIELVDTAEVLEDGTSTGDLVSVLQSQYFYVATTHSNTLQLSWTNADKLAVGGGDVINYSDLPFTQYFRCRGELGEMTVQNDNETYQYNDGTRLTAFNRGIVTRTLKLDNLPEYEHTGIAIGIKHDTFKIDGNRAYNNEDSYEPRYRRTVDLAPVDIEVYLQTDQYENRSCEPAEDPQYATVIDGALRSEVAAGSSYSCERYLKVFFDAGDISVTLTADADSIGTYTAATDDGSSGTISYEIDTGGGFGSVSLPFTLTVGDDLKITRTVTTATGFVRITS